MPRISVRLLFVLLLIAASAALLINTQAVSATPSPAVAGRDADRDKDKHDRDRNNDRGNGGDVVIAQLSDTHIGLGTAPEASANLRRAVEMINQRNVDAVMLTGDVGERPQAWEEAREILKGLRARVFMIPGNHDVHSNDVERWRREMGKDYDVFHVKNVTIIGLDSELLGNFDRFDAHNVLPLPRETQAESDQMLDWFSQQIEDQRREVQASEPRGGGGERDRDDRGPARPLIFAMQHVPISRANGFPNDPKPYWTVPEPYRSRELELLHRLGVRHMFVGHWHKGMVYGADGITYHVAPATSWSPFNAPLGFAIHTIRPDGEVKTEFVYLQ
jgi:DNA repair exonuclease SbcCD nuclease subunit